MKVINNFHYFPIFNIILYSQLYIDICEIIYILGPERLWTIPELIKARRNFGGGFPISADVQIAC